MKVTAVIPARGGSKRFPGKNMSVIGGKTLVRIAVEKCIQVADRVVVSSESREILREADHAGADTLVRPDELATDEATTAGVLKHARDRLSITGEMLLVQCTAPLVGVEDIKRCISQRCNWNMSVLCHRFNGHVTNSVMDFVFPEWIIAGSAWSFGSHYLDRPWYSGNVLPVECDGPHCDIDTPADLELALAVWHHRNWAGVT